MLKACESNRIWSNFYQHRIKFQVFGKQVGDMRQVFCPCSEDTSGWHSNPFVAKEIRL